MFSVTSDFPENGKNILTNFKLSRKSYVFNFLAKMAEIALTKSAWLSLTLFLRAYILPSILNVRTLVPYTLENF